MRLTTRLYGISLLLSFFSVPLAPLSKVAKVRSFEDCIVMHSLLHHKERYNCIQVTVTATVHLIFHITIII